MKKYLSLLLFVWLCLMHDIYSVAAVKEWGKQNICLVDLQFKTMDYKQCRERILPKKCHGNKQTFGISHTSTHTHNIHADDNDNRC